MDYEISMTMLMVDRFSDDVAFHLSPHINNLERLSIDGIEELVPLHLSGSITVLAAATPTHKKVLIVEEIALASGSTFIPILIVGPIIRLGPVIQPGGPACLSCWFKRVEQHSSDLEAQKELTKAYRADVRAQDSGILEPFALLIAQWLREAGARLNSKVLPAGWYRQINMTTGKIDNGLLIGVHGCPICGLRVDPMSRGTQVMRASLSARWPNVQDKG